MSTMKQQCVSDLESERKNCSFDKEELTNIIDGGVEKTQFRRRLGNYMEIFRFDFFYSEILIKKKAR